MFRSALRTRLGGVSAIVLGFILALTVVGPFLAPYDPYEKTAEVLTWPNVEHLLGTDYLGRDILSRLLVGSPASVLASVLVLVTGLLVGVAPALISVYSGRAFEWVSLRVMDTLVTIPFMIFAVAVTQLVGNGIFQAMIVVGVVISPMFFRVTRAAALAVGRQQYVEAAYLFGGSTWYVLTRHVWRKVVPAIAIAGANVIAIGLVIISSLSFLGIGIQPPTPSWGGMLASDLGYLSRNPFSPLFPSLLIVITVVAVNGFADALRDATDAGDHAAGRVSLGPDQLDSNVSSLEEAHVR